LESGVTFARVSNSVASKADNTAMLNARRGRVEAKIDAWRRVAMALSLTE
jgi:hypothetical protein